MASAVVLLILMALAATVRGHPAEGTPAMRFWEAALPGTPMPESIADLVQKGTDHSPLEDHHSAIRVDGQPLYRMQQRWNYRSAAKLPAGEEGLYFREADMRVGSAMTVALPATEMAAFLPRDVADRIPFGNLADALARFGIAPGSREAAQVGDTVRGCRASPLAGEQMSCATSLEGIVLSAKRMLATRQPLAAAASALPSSGLPRHTYVVQSVTPLGGSRFVACHIMPYPYAVYQCHMTLQQSKAYVMSIRGGAGLPTVDMAALCHFDTSNWNPAHPAFEILSTHPGGSTVCHFMPYANLVFGEKTANE